MADKKVVEKAFELAELRVAVSAEWKEKSLADKKAVEKAFQSVG